MTTQPRSRAAGPEALGGGLATAALIVVSAQWLSLTWPWREPSLGIVSFTVLRHQPPQLELLWFALAAGSGIVLLWWIAARLGARAWTPGTTGVMEALGAAALAAALTLPKLAAPFAVALALAAQLWWARRRPFAAASAPPAAPAVPASPRHWAWKTAWLAGLCAIAVLRTPRLLRGIRLVAQHVPDERLASSTWVFQVEMGQHLAWADGLLHGLLHGRDFFCLYGPLYDWLGVGFWELFSRSIRAWTLYDGVCEAVGLLALGLCAAALVRRRALALLAPLLVSTVTLRLGIPLLGLAALVCWIRRSEAQAGAGWAAAAGLAAGVGLLYSQEFALAFVCCAALAFALRRAPAAALLFAGSLTAAVLPLLLWYEAHGALGPMLRDLAAYPGYVMAGYGNLPYPSLRAALPLSAFSAGSPEARLLRVAYLVPALFAGALALTLPRHWLEPSHLRESVDRLARQLGEAERLPLLVTALFGLIGFRSALGRSDEIHIHTLLPVAALLVVVGLDRLLEGAARGGRALLLAWRLGLAGALLWAGGLLPTVAVVDGYYAKVSALELGLLAGRGVPGVEATAQGEPDSEAVEAAAQERIVNRVVAWVRAHSAPDDPVLFLPNDAAYYYLSERANPTRFAVSHQIPTDAHRAEVLEDLRRRPPRLVVWDGSARRLDDIPDRLVLGAAVMDWLEQNYVPATRIGPVRILRRRADAEKPVEEPRPADPEGS